MAPVERSPTRNRCRNRLGPHLLGSSPLLVWHHGWGRAPLHPLMQGAYLRQTLQLGSLPPCGVLGSKSADAGVRSLPPFLHLLARHRSCSAPPILRASSIAGWSSRWSAHLAVAAQRAVALSLLSWPASSVADVEGNMPDLSDVLAPSLDPAAPSPPPRKRPPSTCGVWPA